MKKILPHVMVILFAIFGLAIIAMLMIYSFAALGKLFPDNFLGQIMGMVLFDVAALVWLGTIIYLCKSVGQYAISTIGFVLGLIGTLLLVAVEVMMGGQELAKVPAWAGDSIVWTFIIALVGHVILYYAFKLSAPEISAEISLGYETAAITDEAMKQATEQLIRERGALGQIIAPRMITDVKRNLGLPVAGDVIDLTAQDVDEEASLPVVQVGAPQYVPHHYISKNAEVSRRKAPRDFMSRIKAAREAFSNPWKYAVPPIPPPASAPQTAPIQQSPSTQQVAPVQQAIPAAPPQVEPEDIPFDPKTLTYTPFIARLACQFSNRKVVPGEVLESAPIPGGDFVVRVAGEEEPFARVTLYDLARVMSGQSDDLSIRKNGHMPTVPLSIPPNDNDEHPATNDPAKDTDESPT